MLHLKTLDFELPPHLARYAERLKNTRPETLAVEGCRNVLVKTEYFLPDHPTLLAPPLTIQMVDDIHLLPRVLVYVDYWRRHIEGRMRAVFVDIGDAMPDMRVAQYFGKLN